MDNKKETENISGRRRSERLKPNGKDDEPSSSSSLSTVKIDPAEVLPTEMLTYLLETCCLTMSLRELQQLRLVSPAWRDALEKLWRKQVTVSIDSLKPTCPPDIHDALGLGNNISMDDIDDMISKHTSLTCFLRHIQNPNFDYQKYPLRKFKIKTALFGLNLQSATASTHEISKCLQFDMTRFTEMCGPTITQLQLKSSKIYNFCSFLEAILHKFVALQELTLIKPCVNWPEAEMENFDISRCQNLNRKNLKHLRMDLRNVYWLGEGEQGREIPYPLTWTQFLGNFPNLEKLEMLSEKVGRGFSPQKFLECLKNLNLGNLQHFQMCHDEAYNRIHGELNAVQRINLLCEATFPNLGSLHICLEDFPHSTQENAYQIPCKILDKFGPSLKSLWLCVPLEDGKIFPTNRMMLEKLENLTVSWDLAHFIRSAKYLPNLKSFTVLIKSCVKMKSFGRSSPNVIWLNADNKVAGKMDDMEQPYKEWRQYQQETRDDPEDRDYLFFEDNQGQGRGHDDDDDDDDGQESETDTDDVEVDAEHEGLHQYCPIPESDLPGNDGDALGGRRVAKKRGRGFLFKGYRSLRGALIFEHVTNLRLDFSPSCKVFQKLPKWMPAVTSLEAPIPACAFPAICGMWQKLEKLVLLMERKNEMARSYARFVPIDDCAVVGTKHLHRKHLLCSYDVREFCRTGTGKFLKNRNQAAVDWEYFSSGRNQNEIENYHDHHRDDDDDHDNSGPRNIPNLSYLKELKYLKMEIRPGVPLREEVFRLSDESVFHGIFKLPKLEYLEIVADLNAITINELFSRIPKCIVYRIFDENNGNAFERRLRSPYEAMSAFSRSTYLGRRNFEEFGMSNKKLHII